MRTLDGKCALLLTPALRSTVTTGTDRQRKLGAAFLQLKLVIDNGTGLDHVFLGPFRAAAADVMTLTLCAILLPLAEMTLPQFYQFLKDMEQARSSLEYFS